MSAIAFLNELALPSDQPRVESAILRLSQLLLAARAHRADIEFSTVVPLDSYALNDQGLTFATVGLAAGGSVRDAWRLLITSASRSGVSSFGEAADESRFGGAPAIGLGLAAITEQIAFSTSDEDPWDRESLSVELLRLVEESGEVRETSSTIDVSHASTTDHVDLHAEFLRSRGAGSDIWSSRAARFPHIDFLPRVEAQIASLGPVERHQVDRTLTALQSSLEMLGANSADQIVWGTHVTPEHESRRELCTFEDLDGEVRYFDTHARFTPDPGRIHFRLVPEAGKTKIRVAHVGRKLGA